MFSKLIGDVNDLSHVGVIIFVAGGIDSTKVLRETRHGKVVIFESSSQEEIEAFVAGLHYAYILSEDY